MKTKKFFILSFLMMMTMLLAGCSTRIEQNKIREATEVAENIKKAKEEKKEYSLPKGYEQVLDAQNVNEKIIILKTQNNGDTLRLTFDLSNESIQLIDIVSICDVGSIIFFVFIMIVFTIVISVAVTIVL